MDGRQYLHPKQIGWYHVPGGRDTGLEKMLKHYDYDVKVWKAINYPHLIKSDKKELIKELDKMITIKETEDKRYKRSLGERKNSLELLQDFRTQKLKEIVFP